MSEADRPKRVTISIKLSPVIWKQAKRVALEKDLTLSQLVENAILREMTRISSRPAGEPVA